MKDVLERGLVFIREVKSIFEKADGERRNCPRCGGSGLLKPRTIWHWDSRSFKNDPCWFCEGVGVMPLFGLSGFMLGRASAAINTEKLREPVNPPVQPHLCLGKYPGSRSRFRSYRPEHTLPSLLYKPEGLPVWVSDALEELALQNSEENDNGGEAVANLNMAGLLEGSKSLLRVGSHSTSSAPSSTSAVRPRFGQSSPTRLLYKGADNLLLHNSVTSSALEMKTQPITGKRQDYPGGRMRTRMTPKANHALTAPMVSSARHRIFERSRNPERKEFSEVDQRFLSLASGPQLIPRMQTKNGSIRVKYVRRRRNHIREKMEKETIQSTCRLRRLLYTKPEHPSSPDSAGMADALQTFSGSWKDLSQKCLAELTASNHQQNKLRVSQLGARASYPSRVNQPFYGKLVGNLQLLPSVAKSLKW